METWRYRGQEIVSEQIAFLREFIREHPTSSPRSCPGIMPSRRSDTAGWRQVQSRSLFWIGQHAALLFS